MPYLLITVIVIILVLVVVMFFILKNTVNTVNDKTKTYFVDKLQEYDYLIDEKEKKLNELEDLIKNKELGLNEEKVNEAKGNYDFDYSIIDLLNKTEYQDKDIFELGKKIENNFVINYEDLIKDFLSKISPSNKYDFCVNLRKKFTSDVIYDLKTKLEFEDALKEIIDSEEYKVYEVYKSMTVDNNIESFIDYLDQLVDLNNPSITILVGNSKENYDYLDKNIKTVVSEDIYRGIKIIYKNKIYDFSLNEGNV